MDFSAYGDYNQANLPIFEPGGAPSSTSGGTGSSSSQSQSSTQMIPGMMGVYSQLLGLNQQNYGNVMGAYNQGQGNLSSGLPGAISSYGKTNQDVQGILGMGQVLGQNGNWGIAAPAAQAIGQTYAANTGNTTQQMTNAGLGNTTAVGNAQTQNALSAAQAYGGLGAQLAQTAAGYQAQEGNAASAARLQGMGMQTGLTQAALGPLGQQFGNTAGALAGPMGSSSSNSQNKQTSQQQQPQQQPPGGNTGLSGGIGGGQGSPGPYGYPSSSSAGSPGSSQIQGGSPPGLSSSGTPYNPDTGGGGFSGSVGVMGATSYNPGLNGGFYAGNTLIGGPDPGSGFSGKVGGQSAVGPNSGFNMPGQLPGAGGNYSQNADLSQQYGLGGESVAPASGGADATSMNMTPQGPGSESGDGTMGQSPWPGAKATYAVQGAQNTPVQIGWH